MATSKDTLLLRFRYRDVDIAPKLAVGDGALGFWTALAEVFPTIRTQRCWVHKTVNALDKLPKALHGQVKSALHDTWQADSRARAEKDFDRFIATYKDKYSKAVHCLVKDRQQQLRLLRFPGGTLANDQPDRVDVCHHPFADGKDTELPQREKRTEYGSSLGDEC